MKTIGLLGGMSHESTTQYYKNINKMINEAMGKSTSAKIILYSFDFEQINKLQHDNKWEELTDMMVNRAQDLKNCGVDFVAICTNTMHLMADDIEKRVGIEVLHIAKAAANEIKKQGIKKVALLGTKFTMTGDFYSGILNEAGIEVIIPQQDEMEIVHGVIYNELIVGNINDESRKKYVKIIDSLKSRGAQGVVLGCTEIPLLVKQSDVSIRVFDTTSIHCKAICEKAID